MASGNVKSKVEQLASRGFVAPGAEKNFPGLTFEQQIGLLRSNLPNDRTIGARLLAQNLGLHAIKQLIGALISEKKLYTKLGICNALVSFGKDAVVPLVEMLGKIGNNQHKRVPETNFKKANYPLPRDIAARTIIRIGPLAIPELLKVLDGRDVVKLSEAIDAIGYICFYKHQPHVSQLLIKCFESNPDNSLIKWKIFRAMGAFPESLTFLQAQLTLNNGALKQEIERSLSLIKLSS